MSDHDEASDYVMKWYVVKVQSNREKSIRDSIQRRVRRDGLDSFFGEIVIAVERVVDSKSGKKRITEQKLFPGYLMVQMCLTEESWFLVRSVSGVGDFTGASGKPTALDDAEAAKILRHQQGTVEVPSHVLPAFKAGDVVKICDGAFDGFTGSVGGVDVAVNRVTVLIEIFGRPTPVDLELWQVEQA